ncbi:hypothetical protein [Chroogloeocystis siderophila]|jgi:uncharacterized protein YihD (DUF1040 family)|uniref:Uncharacterized protein n=1 Tax=Chroogloeocystis siderophila 5.2 s.c.1 TaxID=247279 RepID=A0A1U7HQH6_9CHRO|nr:hypothetical protein [Chroogloeocystis siderophila]OKH25821.1 hypothetical protein NIES1031_12575 [Chroogloeocystis siderophila 5.2 s.c.1]
MNSKPVLLLTGKCAVIAGLILSNSARTIADQSFKLTQAAQTSQSALEQMDVSEIAKQIMALQKYMYIDNKTKIVTFDSKAARQGGFSKEILELASELIESQNILMRQAAQEKIGNVTQLQVAEDNFPKLKRFHERLKERDRKKNKLPSSTIELSQLSYKVVINILNKSILPNSNVQKLIKHTNSHILIAELTARACGDYSHYIPNYTPYTTGWTTTADPHGALRRLGYHKTAYYASFQGSYGSSYTKERSYTSSYGTCNFPCLEMKAK